MSTQPPMNWQGLQQASRETLFAWAEEQPWCHAMANCIQDSRWHSEGDVWTHTKLVIEQVTTLVEWPSLTQHEQSVLIFTALLHDVAKPLTTEVDEQANRVSSPKHAVVGEHIARGILRDLGCDLATREEIAQLVRYHGRPVFLLERDSPPHEVVKLSWLLNNRLLYLFALADARGRDTDSRSRPEENLHFWKLQAQEMGCFDKPYPFASDHARFVFFQQREPDLHYVPHEDFSCQVTMMAGLPGSGKDTWLSQHGAGIPVVSLDALRDELGVAATENQGSVVQAARERCRKFLRAKEPFALNATNTVHVTRARWLRLFADYGARIRIIYLEPPFDRLLRQNRRRQDSVPESVIQKLANKCQPPTWAECHSLTMSDG